MQGNVAKTLEKLAEIGRDLERSDRELESWDFGQLCEALCQWVKRDPAVSSDKDRFDTKEKLPIHLVLGNRDYARVKTSTKPLLSEKDGEPVAEKTNFGWIIMSLGINFDRNAMYALLTHNTQHDFEDLCRLDVLGSTDAKENDQHSVYDEYKGQLNPARYYEANLLWKPNHPTTIRCQRMK